MPYWKRGESNNLELDPSRTITVAVAAVLDELDLLAMGVRKLSPSSLYALTAFTEAFVLTDQFLFPWEDVMHVNLTSAAFSERPPVSALLFDSGLVAIFDLPTSSRSDHSMQLNTARRASFDEGSLDQYLREISQYPLITREEEVTLAQRIKQQEPEALDKLVRSNLRFVVSVAKKYQNQGVSLSDLINEGNLGLIRAAHKFDETKGIKFISYAVWWIRQAILQALAEQSRIVRVPLNRAGTLHRIGKRSSALLQELGREPTPAEIAEGMEDRKSVG